MKRQYSRSAMLFFYVFLMMIINRLCIKRLEKAFAKELQSDYGFPGSLD